MDDDTYFKLFNEWEYTEMLKNRCLGNEFKAALTDVLTNILQQLYPNKQQ